MSLYQQQMDSAFSNSRNGRGDVVLGDGANPMQSMDLGAGKQTPPLAGVGSAKAAPCKPAPCSTACVCRTTLAYQALASWDMLDCALLLQHLCTSFFDA